MKNILFEFLIIVIFVNHFAYCDDEGYFTVVGSNVIKVSKPYHVSVTYQNYQMEKNIQIKIAKMNDSDEDVILQNVTLQGDGVQDFDFNIKNQSAGNYQIKVVSLTGAPFESIRVIRSIMKKCSILIQTDKSIYKPSETVKYRVIVVDEDTKPYKFEKAEIFITDDASNRINQLDVPVQKFTSGVFQNEFLLSDSPVLGTWEIHVKVDNEDHKVKSFDVLEYALPTYEMTLDVSQNPNFKDDILYAAIEAKYTFGKAVKGNATVTASLFATSDRGNPYKVTKSIKIDGKNLIEFSLKDDFGVRVEDFRLDDIKADFNVTFEDELSGIKKSKSVEVYVHKSPYTIKIHTDPTFEYNPNDSITVQIAVNIRNGKIPVTDSYNHVVLEIGYTYPLSHEVHPENGIWDKVDFYTRYYSVIMEAKLINGRASFNIKTDDDLNSIWFKAEYLDVRDYRKLFKKHDSLAFADQSSALKTSLVTERPSISKNLSINVTSIYDMNQLTYQIFSKGELIKTKTVRFETAKEFILDLMPQKSMSRKSKIIIHYISESGEIVSSTLEVAFENELPNFVDLKLSTNTSKPGDNVTFSVNASPNSYVGLLGIDQSVLLLKRGNDFEREVIFSDLYEFERFIQSFDNYWNYLHSVYHEDYKKVGAVVLTNANQTLEYFDRNSNNRVSGSEPLSINNQISKTDGTVKIRKNFPETWIFDSFELDLSAKKEITKIVPDTITSWVITGFSIDSENGFGLTKQPSKLNVFLPFFVTANLPYSVKRGEVVSIPIAVYNYLETDQSAVVTLYNSNKEFEFVEAEDSNNRAKRDLETEKKKEVMIKSNEGALISFIIRPLKAGSITIKVTAVAQKASDGIERQLKVEPEGVVQYMNEAVLIGLVKGKEFKKQIDIVVPEEAVPDSTKIEISVVGDIMGATIENLDHLIKLPTGCGEQNMLKFVPNILVLDYLTSINKLSPKTSAKAKKYIESGYQNEQKYKHDDGSYSAFGKSDKSGSTWLTAFVAKTYNKASKYIQIDENEINEAMNFLKNIQADDGSFPEVGNIFQQKMQGGSSKGVALTAYTLSTFLEVKQYSKKFRGTVKKALDYIVKNLDQIEDNYSLSIVSYALQLARHPVKDDILNKIKSKSLNANGLRYWKNEGENKKYHLPNSINIELSSYAMLAFLEANQIKEAIPIMKWLITQRNKNGGFQSTQDTVIGLQALAEFAAKIYSPNTDINISVKPENSDPIAFHLDSDNSLVLQKHQLLSDVRHFEITTVGVGFSVLQISYKYNLLETEKLPSFILKPEVSSKSNKKFLNLVVCTNFIPEPKVKKSNMAILEVNLPTGFAFDSDHTNEILKLVKVKKVETKDAETVMMVYFDDIDSNEICPEFKAFRIHSVAKQKPASIVIYDYYDNSRRARAFYNPPEISFCDICEDNDDCLDACESPVIYPN